MLKNTFRIASLIMSKTKNIRFPLIINSKVMRICQFAFCTSATGNQYSQFAEKLNKRNTDFALEGLEKLQDLDQEKALNVILNQVKYFRFGPELLINETFQNVIHKHTNKTVYLKYIALLSFQIFCEMKTSLKNKEIGKQELQQYQEQLNKLQDRAKTLIEPLTQFQRFYFAIPFVKIQLLSEYESINFLKSDQDKKVFIKQRWKVLIQDNIDVIGDNIRNMLKCLAQQQKEQNKQKQIQMMKYTCFQVIYDFGEQIAFVFDMAKEMLRFGDKEEFEVMISAFVKKAEEAFKYYEDVKEIKWIVNSPILLRQKLVISQYYLEKIRLQKENPSDQALRKLRQENLQKAQRQYICCRDDHLSFLKKQKYVLPIMQELVLWKFQLLEEYGVSSEELEEQMEKEKLIYSEKMCNQDLKQLVVTIAEKMLGQYMEVRPEESVEILRFFDLDNLI